MRNKLTVHNTTPTSTEKSNLNVAQKHAQCSTRPRYACKERNVHIYIYIFIFMYET